VCLQNLLMDRTLLVSPEMKKAGCQFPSKPAHCLRVGLKA
jgi:hypothetical protein